MAGQGASSSFEASSSVQYIVVTGVYEGWLFLLFSPLTGMSGVYYILMNKNNGLSKICYRIVEKSTGRGFLGTGSPMGEPQDRQRGGSWRKWGRGTERWRNRKTEGMEACEDQGRQGSSGVEERLLRWRERVKR